MIGKLTPRDFNLLLYYLSGWRAYETVKHISILASYNPVCCNKYTQVREIKILLTACEVKRQSVMFCHFRNCALLISPS